MYLETNHLVTTFGAVTRRNDRALMAPFSALSILTGLKERIESILYQGKDGNLVFVSHVIV